MDRGALTDAVDVAFAATADGLAPWPDPRPSGGPPREDEYSRLLDPAKYRLLGARFEAWAQVLEARGLCRRVHGPETRWREQPSVHVTRTERLQPVQHSDALPLEVIHSRIEDCAEAGLVLGVGDPATSVASIPDCGCDACDGGSEPLLEQLDDTVWAVVSGAFLEVREGSQWVLTLGELWTANGFSRTDDPASWLADPGDRSVTRGAAWDGA